MNAQELHIDFDIDLQKINSNATLNIKPEEKDWLLNKETIKFLNSVTRDSSNPKQLGFEEDTKRLKDVAPLIKAKKIEVEPFDTERGRFILPPFVFKPLTVEAIFFKNCYNNEFSKTKNLNVYTFKVDKAVSSFKVTIKVQGVPSTIFDTANLPSSYKWEEHIYLVKALLINFKLLNESTLFQDNGYEIHYEWFHNQYRENTFFFVGGSTLTEVTVETGIIYKTGEVEGTEKTVLALPITLPSISTIDYFQRPCRIVSHEPLAWKLTSNISNSLPESPLATFDRNFGYVYFPKNIIIKDVILTYICKPNLIDIHLGQSLNLDSDTCLEIVARTVKFTKALIDSGNYEKYFNETNLIE